MASNSKRKSSSSGSRTPQPTPRKSSTRPVSSSTPKRSASRSYTSKPSKPKKAKASKPAVKKKTSSKNSAIGKKLSPSSTTSVDKRAIANRMGNPIGDSLRSTQSKSKDISSKLSAAVSNMPHISGSNIAGKLGLVAAGVVGVCILGLVGFVLVLTLGLFSVNDVEYVATKHVDTASLERMVQIDDKANLLTLSKADILEQLKSNPWIRDVSIERHFPHGVTITPIEREVFAIAYVNTTDIAWAIGDDDCWIAPVSLSTVVEEAQAEPADDVVENTTDESVDDMANDASDELSADTTDDTQAMSAEDIPEDIVGTTAIDNQQRGAEPVHPVAASDVDDSTVTDTADTTTDNEQGLNLDGLEGYEAALAVARDMGAILITDCGPDIDPQPGQPVEGGGVANALAYAHEFSPSFMENVRSFSAANVEATSCYLESGVEVALGKADKVSYKERATLAVLEQDSSVVYINVRTPESPTWRSVTI